MLKQLLSQFQTTLQSAGMHPLPCEQAVECLPTLIAQFENRPENRAGRRVRRAPRKRVYCTLKHLKRAAAASAKGARAGAAGREAHKLLRAIRTFPDFETLEKRASSFIGFQNRTSHRRNEREMRKQAPVIQLGNSLALRRVVTAGHLTSIGRRLKLCVAQQDSGYQHSLRDGSLVFWSIQRDGEVVGLLSINADNEVDECNGPDHEPIGLDRAVMLQILRELNVTADNCEAFANVGALSIFLERTAHRPDATASFQDSLYRAWGWKGRLAVSQDQRQWSLFCWCSKSSEWVDATFDQNITLGQMVDLAAHCPKIAALVREQRALAEPRVEKTTGHRRRQRRRRRHRPRGI